jgi:hypothetical protein
VSSRTRSILVWGLFVFGTLVVFVGSLTVWVNRQALNTDSWVEAEKASAAAKTASRTR